jgi:hypothetical protein
MFKRTTDTSYEITANRVLRAMVTVGWWCYARNNNTYIVGGEVLLFNTLQKNIEKSRLLQR